MCTFVCTCVLVNSLYPVCGCVVCIFLLSYRAVYLFLAHCVLCVLFHIHEHFCISKANWKCTHVTVPIAVHIALSMFTYSLSGYLSLVVHNFCVNSALRPYLPLHVHWGLPPSLHPYLHCHVHTVTLAWVSISWSAHTPILLHTWVSIFLNSFVHWHIWLSLQTICTQPKHISTKIPLQPVADAVADADTVSAEVKKCKRKRASRCFKSV